MSRIPPHTARIVSDWPSSESRPRARRHRTRAARHALARGTVALARTLHLLRTPPSASVPGHVGRHA